MKHIIFVRNQKERLMKYTDLGYSEAVAKIINYSNREGGKNLEPKLSKKDRDWTQFFVDQTGELGVLIERLEYLIKNGN